MKCRSCNSRVDHSNLVNVNGDRHFVCSHCRRQLVHRMGIGFAAVDAITFVLSVVAVALLLQHSMRLIERRSDGYRPY